MSIVEKRPVVITGGTGVLGGSFARALLNDGYPVIVTGRGKTRLVDEVVSELKQEGPDGALVWGFTVDLGNESDVQSMFEEIVREAGVPGALINAAGGNRGKAPFVETDVDIFAEVLLSNLIGGLVVPSKIAAKIWLEHKTPACIINIASMASYLPLSGVWAYGAAKSGVMNLTAGLAKEFGSHGIRVNAIAPGFFVGNQNKALLYDDFEAGKLSDRGKQIIAHTPFGRFGDAKELLGTLRYLLDDQASGFVTGVTIPVDGGYLIDNI